MNWITVYPQGMSDDPVNHDQGWNVPYNTNDMQICKPDTWGPCYDSCNQLSLCYTCSWTTCYDDVAFVDALIEKLDEELCIDKENLHTSGASNGAMFTYYLSSQRPGMFQSWWLNYGQPLLGYLKSPAEMNDKKLLAIHGRSDVTIPIAGGIDGDNQWIYEPEDSMITQWAVIQDCNMTSYAHVKTPFDHAVHNKTAIGSHLKCFEYTEGCKGRVMRCFYNGAHGDDPPYNI